MNEKSTPIARDKANNPMLSHDKRAWLVAYTIVCVRRALQTAQAGLKIAKSTAKRTFSAASSQAIQVFTYCSVVLYGIYAAIFTYLAAKQIVHIWSGKGHYADKFTQARFKGEDGKRALQHKQIKTTFFTGLMAALDLSFFALVVLLLTGVVTMASPLVAPIYILNAAIMVVKYAYSFARLIFHRIQAGRELKKVAEQLKAGVITIKEYRIVEHQYQLDSIAAQHKAIHTGVKMVFSLLLGAAIIAALLLVPPFGALVASAMLVAYGIGRIVYDRIIQKKLSAWRDKKIAKLEGKHQAISEDAPVDLKRDNLLSAASLEKASKGFAARPHHEKQNAYAQTRDGFFSQRQRDLSVLAPDLRFSSSRQSTPPPAAENSDVQSTQFSDEEKLYSF